MDLFNRWLFSFFNTPRTTVTLQLNLECEFIFLTFTNLHFYFFSGGGEWHTDWSNKNMNKLNKNKIIYFYFQYAKPSKCRCSKRKKKVSKIHFQFFHISKFCLLLPEEAEPPKSQTTMEIILFLFQRTKKRSIHLLLILLSYFEYWLS